MISGGKSRRNQTNVSSRPSPQEEKIATGVRPKIAMLDRIISTLRLRAQIRKNASLPKSPTPLNHDDNQVTSVIAPKQNTAAANDRPSSQRDAR
ncbi:hypothetical protein PSA3335_07535 [Pseudomonas savastanoi pv. savastanoi NCPPB 3335]|uniref:Uncharacterized protein n=1 Tax=Pseudomonas savastanoi pv. savastanoi NCPPB 3335 TaxID=693985 RepID=A0ABC8B9K3_PSESS|nr:hypothetical protein PSA3335_07535 [Pseudomonas savastanoi pv. savastanoi NCPPB 3335]